jgi:hypothetical protein
MAAALKPGFLAMLLLAGASAMGPGARSAAAAELRVPLEVDVGAGLHRLRPPH